VKGLAPMAPLPSARSRVQRTQKLLLTPLRGDTQACASTIAVASRSPGVWQSRRAMRVDHDCDVLEFPTRGVVMVGGAPGHDSLRSERWSGDWSRHVYESLRSVWRCVCAVALEASSPRTQVHMMCICRPRQSEQVGTAALPFGIPMWYVQCACGPAGRFRLSQFLNSI